jgi:hypothetical protein
MTDALLIALCFCEVLAAGVALIAFALDRIG